MSNKNLYNSVANNSIKKWGKDLNMHFSEEDKEIIIM